MGDGKETDREPNEKKRRGFSSSLGDGIQFPTVNARIFSDLTQISGLQGVGFQNILKDSGIAGLQGVTEGLKIPNLFSDAIKPLLPDYSALMGSSFQSILQNQFGGIGAITDMLTQLRSLDLPRPASAPAPSPNTAYSEDFHSPDDYFAPHELVINNFDELHKVIQSLIRKNSSLEFLWRGQRDASWGLHSSLYRELIKKQKVRSADKKHRKEEPYPTEDDMVAAEQAVLNLARADWRFDDMSALETFARLQHFGAPTRLIDVTRNPYIAAWFAVESSSEHDELDGRIFATATLPVLPPEKRREAETLTQVRGELAHAYQPFWHLANSNEARTEIEWGTGTIRRFWVPPLYEQRILAQNGCFLLDGVPIGVQQNSGYFKRKGERNRSWKKADLLASGSIFTKLYDPKRAVQINQRRAFPPTFTFRITAAAKAEIRQVLEERFSYGASTMYPDIEGLATHLRNRLDEII